jgi:hypothetical protein
MYSGVIENLKQAVRGSHSVQQLSYVLRQFLLFKTELIADSSPQPLWDCSSPKYVNLFANVNFSPAPELFDFIDCSVLNPKVHRQT